MQESQLPAFSADSRQFFTTTSAQIDRMASELDGLIGKEGTLVKFTEETQAMLKAADLPATSKLTREAASDSRLASDDLRRSLPAIRDSLEQLRELARLLEEQPSPWFMVLGQQEQSTRDSYSARTVPLSVDVGEPCAGRLPTTSSHDSAESSA